MTENNESIRGEIQEYIEDLSKTRHNLVNFQTSRMDNTLLCSEVNVIVAAIDGTVKELSVPGLAESVNLKTIVSLSESVRDIKTQASKVLAKKSA